MYFAFALYVENAIVLHCYKNVLRLVAFSTELRKHRRICGVDTKEVRVLPKNKHFLAPCRPFHLSSSRIQFAPFTSSVEKGLQEIVKYGADAARWTRLFWVQESIARIVWILLSNKFLKMLENIALVDCYSVKNCQKRSKHFQYLRYGCLLSRHSFNLEKSKRREVQQIDELKESIRRKCEETVSKILNGKNNLKTFRINFLQKTVAFCQRYA